jgi:hypothetical protein
MNSPGSRVDISLFVTPLGEANRRPPVTLLQREPSCIAELVFAVHRFSTQP